jgi:membrane peptidoglycan carboxypeptidase
MAMLAIAGLVATVAVFAFYSQDLPDPHGLQSLGAVGESVVYDRTDSVVLARFGAGVQREPVTYDQLPPILIDIQTAIEDKSFWTNTGVDPLGILSAAIDTLQGNERGASTITQQLVRERLLDPALVADPSRVVERKLKEIIQSVRVTEAYPGEQGKQQIITAYFNSNYYGNGSYGVLAAAQGYFGVTDLHQLTLGQMALLAALPQSPSSFDLVRNAVTAPNGTLYVPLDQSIPIVARRDYILDLLASDPSRLVLTGNEYSAADFEAAKNEPIVLGSQASQQQQQWLAPHFIWALRDELAQKLCGGADTCPALEAGGLHIVSTLDAHMQQVAEKWVTAGVFLPHSPDPEAMAAQLGVPYEPWMKKLQNLQVGNGALVAMDYQTGEILAYVGSAGYYRASDATPQFQPQFDVLANGWRQPGSAFKPFNFVTGINDGTMTAASMFMDVTTAFPDGANTYIPTDYDGLERGPVRMRSALQWSLNIPAVKALAINGVSHVFDMAQQFGMVFQGDQPTAGLSLTLGTEVTHPLDATEAYATLANGGRYIGYTHILRIEDANGNDLVPPYTPPAGNQVVSPQADYVMTNILASNTDPHQNPIWGAFALRGPDGRRPATIKTGTNDDAIDLDAFGYIAPPDDAGRAAGEYALVVGAWNGNSDDSSVLRPNNPVFSTDIAAPTWHGFMQEVTADWPNQDFAVPPGITNADVDAWSGMAPTEYTTQTVNEVFIDGTVPGPDTTKIPLQVVTDAAGNTLLWTDGCAGTPVTQGFLNLDNVEAGHPDWQVADQGWIARAKQGVGIAGGPDPQNPTKTSYLFNRSYTPYGHSWGAPWPPTESCVPGASPSPTESLSPSPSESPSLPPTEPPTIEPTPPLTPAPTPPPTLPPTAPPSTPPSQPPTPPPTGPPPSPPPSP